MKAKLFAASMLFAVSSLASAVVSTPVTNFDFGTVTQTSVISDINVVGSFDHMFSFKTGSGTGVLAGVVGIDVVGDLQAQYRFGIGATPLWSSWSALSAVPSDPDTGNFSFTKLLSNLQVGQTYWAELKGSATQANYSVTLAPVPEADSWAMYLAGLGLMGFVARRRRV